MISAPWCKRCQELKPLVFDTSLLANQTITYVEYDDLEDDDPRKDLVKTLPTFLVRSSLTAPWVVFKANQIQEWRAAVLGATNLSFDADF